VYFVAVVKTSYTFWLCQHGSSSQARCVITKFLDEKRKRDLKRLLKIKKIMFEDKLKSLDSNIKEISLAIKKI